MASNLSYRCSLRWDDSQKILLLNWKKKNLKKRSSISPLGDLKEQKSEKELIKKFSWSPKEQIKKMSPISS